MMRTHGRQRRHAHRRSVAGQSLTWIVHMPTQGVSKVRFAGWAVAVTFMAAALGADTPAADEEPSAGQPLVGVRAEVPEVVTAAARPPQLQAGAAWFYLDVEREDGAGGRLVMRHSSGSVSWLLDDCTDFAVSPEGWVLAERRLDPGRHELLMLTGEPSRGPVMAALDFEALTVSSSGAMCAFLARQEENQPLRVGVWRAGGEPELLDWAPTVVAAEGVSMSLAGDTLLLSVPGDDPDLPMLHVLDLATRQITGAFSCPKAQAIMLRGAN